MAPLSLTSSPAITRRGWRARAATPGQSGSWRRRARRTATRSTDTSTSRSAAMHRIVRRSLLTGAPPRPSTHADPGLRRARPPPLVIARRVRPDVGVRRGTDAAPPNLSIEVALSRRRSDRDLPPAPPATGGARTASGASPSCSSPSRSATPATSRRSSPRRTARSPASSARPACARPQHGQRGHGIDFGDGRKNPQHRPQTRGYGTA